MNSEGFTDKDLSRMFGAALQKKTPSGDPLSRLRRNLGYSACWAAILSIFYMLVWIWYPLWPVNLCLLILLLFTIWGMISCLRIRRLLSPPDSPAPVLEEMERLLHLIRKWIRLQVKLGIFVYPFSIVGGGLMGAYLVSNRPIPVLVRDRIMDLLLLAVVVTFVPICAWLARRLAQRSFGRYLDVLLNNIRELRADKILLYKEQAESANR
jgi:hypothetical protein